MPTFEVVGADRETGADRRIMVEADTEQRAAEIAQDGGLLIAKVSGSPTAPLIASGHSLMFRCGVVLAVVGAIVAVASRSNSVSDYRGIVNLEALNSRLETVVIGAALFVAGCALAGCGAIVNGLSEGRRGR